MAFAPLPDEEYSELYERCEKNWRSNSAMISVDDKKRKVYLKNKILSFKENNQDIFIVSETDYNNLFTENEPKPKPKPKPDKDDDRCSTCGRRDLSCICGSPAWAYDDSHPFWKN